MTVTKKKIGADLISRKGETMQRINMYDDDSDGLMTNQFSDWN